MTVLVVGGGALRPRPAACHHITLPRPGPATLFQCCWTPLAVPLAEQLADLSVSKNRLSGPAFPRGWLQSGAMPKLEKAYLNENPQLTGTLPASLAWSQLSIL